MSECTPTERAEQKYPLWLPTGDYEIDCEDYSEMDAAWQNAEAEMQRQAYIAGAECERAKRPDRQQIYKAIREEAKSVDSPCPPWLASRYADAVLALEPEAREERPLPAFAPQAPEQFFDAVRAAFPDKPETREEAELFHDQDGDLWKFTDKGEWFHEEELGEFRQVLSIDAEDQTLTPVGHAELAPDAEVAREVE